MLCVISLPRLNSNFVALRAIVVAIFGPASVLSGSFLGLSAGAFLRSATVTFHVSLKSISDCQKVDYDCTGLRSSSSTFAGCLFIDFIYLKCFGGLTY